MLGGQEAMSGLLAIVNASDADYQKLTEAINNSSGAAQRMAEIRIDNLAGDVTLLKSAAEGAGIAMYEGWWIRPGRQSRVSRKGSMPLQRASSWRTWYGWPPRPAES